MRELGERLKRRRLDRDITLDDVQAATKIRLRYLTALEEGRFDVIPGEVYLKGFLRTYADFLGLDGLELLQSYREMREQRYREAMQAEQADGEDDGPKPPSTPPGSEASGTGVPGPEVATPDAGNGDSPMPSYRPLRPEQRSGASRRWVLPVAVVGLLLAATVVVAVWVASTGDRAVTVTGLDDGAGRPEMGRPEMGRPEGGARPGEAQRPDEVPRDEEGATEEVAGDDAVAAAGNQRSPEGAGAGMTGAGATAGETVRAGAIHLEVEAREACWLRVLADGEPLYEGTMVPGERRAWEAEDRLHVRLGNARGVDLILNGQKLDAPDQDVIEREFTQVTVAQLIEP